MFVDWTILVGVLTIIMLLSVMTAVSWRYYFRNRLYRLREEDHFFSNHLPVTYLTDEGQPQDLWINANSYMIYGGLFSKLQKFRHDMCTDDAGWYHFCLFTAAGR